MLAMGEAGYREVTLLGQNVDAYGRDLPGMADDASGRRAWTFTDLLRHVHDVPGIERIRFATSHPRYFTDRLVRTCAELPKLCEYFHIRKYSLYACLTNGNRVLWVCMQGRGERGGKGQGVLSQRSTPCSYG